ncbi:PolC-type DNA polymerase III [Photobacterium aphoticum]|uniref:DNA-directed DNA polymerase n=1 Tax=Photobacterium aphoticum TaxID=754436 RepID=A0A0J1GRL4_9GAMM|nr:3'-5' exonuclease [Photobacterium aphoticum]KLV02059.1 DNA polymerase III subunit alpha [Photobacterium aphoticum]PSU60307.1 3'-5' exonuclease [Photobacterium aphoticum]GHA34786.1 DNA polymerase III subunit epsilon [Photobacterium aphoticum]
MKKQSANTVIVLDFETTGLSPNMGDRAIEIGAVKIENGQVVDQFQQLMNPGFRVSSFIEGYTGISNYMLADAQPCDVVMNDFADFIQGYNLIAHNASFDQRFLDAELQRIGRRYNGEFACSMLIARRLYQHASNHKLGTLVNTLDIENDGTFHRALADAEMTARLWLRMLEDIQHQYRTPSLTFDAMHKLSKTSKATVPTYLRKLALS